MANRKVQQEIEKCFKAVAIGVDAFDEQYEKYEQSTNPAQREKLVDSIKKECKKLQRLRDQIKTWAAGHDVKDKGPLLEKRELIETKMEAFKAVEKEMKTKAFSKEGLNAANKLDPREQKKDEMVNFLGEMIEKLGHDIERNEAETDQLHSQVKRAKRDTAKQERLSELEHTTERHKWHQGRLELLLRAVENDSVEASDVENIQDNIKDYIDNHQEVDFYEDEEMYDDFHLDEEGGRYGLANEAMDRVQSNEESLVETPEPMPPLEASKKPKPASDPKEPHRRASAQIKSPLPTLATLQIGPPATAMAAANKDMKPAPAPPKPTGEPLKYASAAAAAAASDKAGIGIAPLPAPNVGAAAASAVSNTGLAPLNAAPSAKSSASASPAVSSAHPASSSAAPGGPVSDKVESAKSPAPSHSSLSMASPAVSSSQPAEASYSRDEASQSDSISRRPPGLVAHDHDRETPQTNGLSHSPEQEEDELVFHLPESLRDLFTSYQAARDAAPPISSAEHQRLLQTSFATRPDAFDAEKPRHYRPQNLAAYTPPHYPQEPLPIFDDPRLYSKIDTDSLFYSFYYRQGTYQQYLAARELKNQSWRFHKQYQTWFQRHEEPKNITEDYEQGTYRFFDYESTWMNRRKADFKFAYKFLEDDL